VVVGKKEEGFRPAPNVGEKKKEVAVIRRPSRGRKTGDYLHLNLDCEKKEKEITTEVSIREKRKRSPLPLICERNPHVGKKGGERGGDVLRYAYFSITP